MNKYLLPIYHSKLKPWIKYWLYKKTAVTPVTGTYTLAEGQTPLTLTDSLVGVIKNVTLYGACDQVQREGTNLAELNSSQDTSKYTYSSFTPSNIIVEKTATGGSFYASFTLHIPAAGSYYIKGNTISSQQMYIYTDSLWGTLKEQFTVSAGDFSRGTNFSTAGDYIIGLYGSAVGDYSVKNFMCSVSDSVSYESYGYHPSPTNPSEVQTVSGSNGLMIAKNIFDFHMQVVRLGSIELCKIGDYEDKIYKDNNKWYIEKNVGKVVLNGSENWFKASNIGNHNRYALTWNEGINNADVLCYSNKFKGVSRNNISNVNEISVNNFINILSDSITTLTEWTTWLSSNNTNVYYVLAEKTTTEITDTDLLSDLEDMLNLKTYEGTNTVTFGVLNPKVKLEYLKKD